MQRRIAKPLLGAVLLFLWTAPLSADAPDSAFPLPQKQDKCPVCGMFVAKYPDFLALIRFKDGSRFYFDGVKDMLKFHRDPAGYQPGKKPEDIAAVFVTDYYHLTRIDGFKASYVGGSDVYGPMGKELIPFAHKDEAEQFMKDHKGRVLITFDSISTAILQSLE